jgi:hypothetical protein
LETAPPQDLGGATELRETGFGNVAHATYRLLRLCGSIAISGSPTTVELLLWEIFIAYRPPEDFALAAESPTPTAIAKVVKITASDNQARSTWRPNRRGLFVLARRIASEVGTRAARRRLLI